MFPADTSFAFDDSPSAICTQPTLSRIGADFVTSTIWFWRWNFSLLLQRSWEYPLMGMMLNASIGDMMLTKFIDWEHLHPTYLMELEKR